jgi:hypothetical protein
MKNEDPVEIKKPAPKKTWYKPKLYSGNEIGFFGLGQVQTSTGPYGTPS